jgi:prepilin-type N-terminal cleavage/methylation domain-containing protein
MLTRRRGTSLVELLVALALFGIVGLATLRSLDRQARLHSGMLTVLEARAQHAAAHEAVATELRSISSQAGDLTRLSDSAIVFRLPVGAGVACAVAPDTIYLAPDSTASGQEFARFATTPQTGDTVWLFNESSRDIATDDAWIGFAVVAIARTPGNCSGSPLVSAALDATRPSWRLAVAGTLPPSVIAGAPLRLTRTARFALYRGSTGEHWLGFSEILPATGAWVTIQPVSGPYLPYSAADPITSGVALGAMDSSGARVFASITTTAAIALATRTRTSRSIRIDGLARGLYTDSLHSLIGLRNSR